ncbi:MAG: flagellar type III secretion system pore protein FliP [bacterium]
MRGRVLGRVLLVMLLARPGVAQVGPPDDGGAGARGVVVGIPSATVRPTPAVPGLGGVGDFNPLSIIAGASEALPGGSGQGGDGGVSEGAVRRPGGGFSTGINILLVLTVITLAPTIVLMTTCFLRIVIVLSLLKQALGTQQMPPTQVLLGLSLILTLLVMSPTIDRINAEAIVPYKNGTITSYGELWEAGKQPVRDFMFAQIEATGNYSSLYMVLNYRGIDTSNPAKLTRANVDMISLVPAFVLSEMKVAFLMGFRIYLPFLVIDLVISTILIALNMMMLPPVLISLPFKLLLFVLVDGWQLIVGTLLQSFARPAVPAPVPIEAAVSLGREAVAWVHPLLSLAC